MIVDIHHRCSDFDSYRAASVKSLFNVETGANFDLTVDLPLHERAWQIGVVVGSSGSARPALAKNWAKSMPQNGTKPCQSWTQFCLMAHLMM